MKADFYFGLFLMNIITCFEKESAIIFLRCITDILKHHKYKMKLRMNSTRFHKRKYVKLKGKLMEERYDVEKDVGDG